MKSANFNVHVPLKSLCFLTLWVLLGGCAEKDTEPASRPESTVRPQLPLDPRLEQATSLAVIEITEIKEIDSRPVDGDWNERISFRVVESSGTPPKLLHVPIEFGGMRPGPRPELPTGLTAGTLQEGECYWFLFGKHGDPSIYPHPVMGWWPDDDQVPKAVRKALESDRYAGG